MAAEHVKVGQIWRDQDPRFRRYVRVLELPPAGGCLVKIVTVPFDGTEAPAKWHRPSWSNITRFCVNGFATTKQFVLVKDAPDAR